MNVYLIASDSYKQINDQVEKIIGDSLNVIKYDLRTDSLSDVINEANYFSLTNEMKYLIIKSNNLFKASKGEEKSDNNDVKLLENYLKVPNDLCTLIFTSFELPDKRKKIYKEIDNKGKVILIPALNKKELTYKCMEILKAKGYQTDYEVANFIVENSYVNYDIMTNELEKIYILLKPQALSIACLKDIISISITNNTFGFINAIITRNLKEAHKLSANFEKLKIDPSMVIIMLAKEIQILYMLKSKVSGKDIQNFFHKEDWQMKSYYSNANLYTLNELKKIIIRLNDYDYKLKSGLLDKSVILDLIALEFCE